jgi:toxin HigB-1
MSSSMRIDFDDDDLRRLYLESDFVLPRLGRDITRAYRKKVGFIEGAESELDLRNYRALHFEKLQGDREGQYSIRLNDQWRLILRFETDDAGRLVVIVEIVDYH